MRELRIASILLLLFLCTSTTLLAQNRETAIWTTLAVSKSINERWSASAQTELRTGRDNKDLYLWYIDGNAKYKINSWLAAHVGFDYIKIHSYATSSRGDVWRTDIRPYIAATINWTMGPLRANLNESLAYNWLPEMEKDGVLIKGKGYYLLKHRLIMEYPISNSRFTPLVKFELRETKKLERIRFTLGTNIKISTNTSLEVGYIYQDKHNSMKTNALSLGYKIRL